MKPDHPEFGDRLKKAISRYSAMHFAFVSTFTLVKKRQLKVCYDNNTQYYSS